MFLKVIPKYINNLFIFSFLVYCQITFSQTKEQLQDKKEKLKKEIDFTNKLLNSAKEKKKNSTLILSTLNKKISVRSEIINTMEIEGLLLSKQLEQTSNNISELNSLIKKNQDELNYLKLQYAEMLNSAYYSKNHKKFLAFIFASNSFNQALKRIRFFKEYEQYRKNQTKLILEKENNLALQLEKLNQLRVQLKMQINKKNIVLSNKKIESDLLSKEKQNEENIILELSKKEKDLLNRIEEKKKKSKELDNQIKKIIEEEIRKAKEMAKNNGSSSFEMTPEQKIISNQFISNEGNLPWPVARGIIVESFGKQKHAVLPGVVTYNNGIKIATEEASSVRSIFNGKVSNVLNIPGSGKAVIISHGNYFSVYSGLSKVYVKSAENVKTKQSIGLSSTNTFTNETIVELQIWKGSQKLDPAKWIYRAY